MVVKMMAVRPVDIDEGALRRNGTGAITVRPHRFEDDDGRVTRAYAVSADFFLPGTDQRSFRTLEHAMGFVVGLVAAAREAASRSRLKQPTIEIQVEL